MKGITIAGACGCAFCLPCLSVADEEGGAANLPAGWPMTRVAMRPGLIMMISRTSKGLTLNCASFTLGATCWAMILDFRSQ